MPTYYPLKIYQILTRLLTVSLSNMYSASADVGRLSFKDAAKIQQKFEIHKKSRYKNQIYLLFTRKAASLE